MASEHPFPAALRDLEACYRGRFERGINNIALTGDSAGGNLALVLLSIASARDPGQDGRSKARFNVEVQHWAYTKVYLLEEGLIHCFVGIANPDGRASPIVDTGKFGHTLAFGTTQHLLARRSANTELSS